MAIAKLSKFTKGLSGVIGLEDYYQKEWIGVDQNINGFVCLRHLVRKPYTSIYYLGVRPEGMGQGIGRALIEWAKATSQHREIVLLSEKENRKALNFYHKNWLHQNR